VAFLVALPYSSDEESFTYQSSGCLGSPDRAVDDVDIWVEGSDILMAHHDAVYNCCSHVVVYWEDHRPLIKLIEREDYPDSEPCRCMCNHEVSARLSNLPAGTYTVEVWDGMAERLLASSVVEVGQ
jgi:hypothetical protein